MVSRWPSPSIEKELLTRKLEWIYWEFNSNENIYSSAEVIKTQLMNHIAITNPKLAEQIIQSPTEAHVLGIIGKVEIIANAKAANDERFILAA